MYTLSIMTYLQNNTSNTYNQFSAPPANNSCPSYLQMLGKRGKEKLRDVQLERKETSFLQVSNNSYKYLIGGIR